VRAQINNKLLATLEPRERPFEVRDPKTTGFILRVQPTGSMSYFCEYDRGKRVQIGSASKITPTIAREQAKKVLAQATVGVDPVAAKKADRARTFFDYIDNEYGPWARQHLKRGKDAAARLKTCFAEFSTKRLADISPAMVDKWRSSSLRGGRQKTGVNRDLDTLKAALNKAVEWEIIERNPIGSVKRYKIDDNPPVRFLSHAEEARLRTALEKRLEELRQKRASGNAWRRERGYPELPLAPRDHLRPIVLLAMNTGLRRGELFNLEWQAVNFNEAQLTVHAQTAKTGTTRHVPLNQEAVDALAEWKGDIERDGLVFPGPDGEVLGNIDSAWRSLTKRAKLTDFRFHDLRHHFASKLVMAHVPLNTVRELLGHTDIKMTLRYAHLDSEHKAAAVARLNKPAANTIAVEIDGKQDEH
jgi:integrase